MRRRYGVGETPKALPYYNEFTYARNELVIIIIQVYVMTQI